MGAWVWADDFANPTVVQCVSVGFLIAQTDAAIALAPNLGDLDEERVQCCGIIRIPWGAIRHMSDL